MLANGSSEPNPPVDGWALVQPRLVKRFDWFMLAAADAKGSAEAELYAGLGGAGKPEAAFCGAAGNPEAAF